MDIFAHSIWTAIAAKKYNSTTAAKHPERPLIKVGWAALWGIIPDLLAFGLPFLVLGYAMAVSDVPFEGLRKLCPCVLDAPGKYQWISDFIPRVYQISHSLVIFGATFLAVWAVRRRAPLAMLGWMLHILIDMFTHAASFFPTPLFWPLSDAKFLHGISWADPRFMIINYAALLVVFWLVFLRKK